MLVYCQVIGSGKTQVRNIAHHIDLRVGCLQFSRNGRGAGVVDHRDAKVSVGLGCQAVQAAGQYIPRVPADDDDCNAGHLGLIPNAQQVVYIVRRSLGWPAAVVQ